MYQPLTLSDSHYLEFSLSGDTYELVILTENSYLLRKRYSFESFYHSNKII